MPVVPGPALGTALGFAQPLHGHGCSSVLMAAGELVPSPSQDPFPAEGPLSGVERRMKDSSQPLKPFILPVLVSAVTPQPQLCPWGAGRVGGRGTSHLGCRFFFELD